MRNAIFRLTAALLTALLLAANLAYAQVPGGGKGKPSLRLLETMDAGTSQDFIVVFDDKAIEEEAQTLQSTMRISSHRSLIIERKATRYAEKKQEILSAFGSSEATVLKHYSHLPVNFVRVHSRDALDKLLAHPGVLGVYENRLERKALAEGLPLIGQTQVAAQGNLGAGTAVAVLDTGTDYTKPAFGSCTSPGLPASCKVVYAQDFAPSDGKLDDDGHGTNVAGIVAGVAPGTKIVALDVFNGPTASSSDILNAINWVIANKATYNIVAMNLSLGSGQYTATVTSGPYNSAVNNARAAGILTIAAAGNDGFTNALTQPAASAGVVSVGAVYDSAMGPMYWGDPLRCQDVTTAADKVTCFSNSASFLTVLAPGAQITAAGITAGGTSQAAPHVAGAVAVLRAAFPNETLDQTVARLASGVMVTDNRNDVTKPRLSLQRALGITASCTYSISETGKSFSSNSSSGSVAVTTGAGCTWNAASSTGSSSWIAVTAGASGSGSGTVNYLVSANANVASRTGTITIAGQTYTVTQSGSVGAVSNILLNPGFENGPVSWVDSTANGLPVITTYLNPTNNNNWYAWLCGYDNCVDNLYQDIAIPADAQSAYVQFNYWIDTAETSAVTAYDSMTVRVYNPPNANSYTTIASFSNLNAKTGWALTPQIDVSAFKGRAIRLQFSATTDMALATDFFVDDVTLVVSGAAPDTQPPSVPTGLTAAAISASAINLAWSASTDNVRVAAYKLYRNGALLASLGNVTGYGDTGLVAGTGYSYTISACDAAGNCSAQSAATIGTTAPTFSDTQPPTVPANFSGTATSVSAISLSWSASSDNLGVTQYKVYRNGILLATLGNVRTYADTGLTPWTSFSYTVSACDASGNCSAQSQAISVSTLTPFSQATQIVIEAPVSTQSSGNVVNISIAKITNRSSSYTSGSLRIELWAYSTSYTGAELGYKTASIRTVDITGGSDQLAPNRSFSGITLSLPYTPPPANYTHFVIFVEEYNTSASCPSSDHWCYDYYLNLYETQPPTVPTGLTATVTGSSQINLAWTAATDNVGVATYKVYRNGIFVATLGNVTSYNDLGLTASTTYSYTVSACDAAGNCSAQSTAASATTLAPPDTQPPSVPTGLTATTISSTQINLAWTASTDSVGVTAYKIHSGGNLVATLGNVTSTSRTNAPATTYSYTVSACDAAGNCSAQSAAASATTPAPSDTQAPTVPTGLTATPVSGSVINLAWTAATDNVGVATYKLYRSDTLLATLGNVTSYRDTGLRNSTVYSYTVQTCDAAGNCSAQSTAATATTQTLTTTTTPTTSDFNGDGKSDILWRNSGTGEVVLYQMNGTSVGSQGSVRIVSPDWKLAGTGDFNGDGKGDILWRNANTGAVYLYALNGTAVSSEGAVRTVSLDWEVAGVGDFDGNGKADILWRHAATGALYIYFMNGSSVATEGAIGTVSLDWEVAGTGDFNGDGKADILWRNRGSGQINAYLMNGASVAAQAMVRTVSLNWEVAGIGDFNGDGKADILWRNLATGEAYVYLMNGTGVSSEESVRTVSLDWEVVQIGDFNGDGKADILWRNRSTGQAYAYLMNGTAVASEASVGTVSNDWKAVTQKPRRKFKQTASLKGIDTSADGKADILWRNASSGQVHLYQMNGSSVAAEGSVRTVSPDWEVAGYGDFNGDGKTDILWRNVGTGLTYLYLLNGTTVAVEGVLRQVSLDWKPAAIADFNGDGKTDIMWRHVNSGATAFYFLNGTSVTSEALGRTVSLDWEVAGTGDFNGDGKADIAWRNITTGATHFYFMNGSTVASEGAGRTVSLDWELDATGDFNADGKADILWRNAKSGATQAYLMNGANVASEGAVRTVSLDWEIAGIGDYNGDGRSDILWRNLASGATHFYFLNGASLIAEGPGRTVSLDWSANR